MSASYRFALRHPASVVGPSLRFAVTATLVTLIVLALAGVASAGVVESKAEDLPPPRSTATAETTRIYAADGSLLATLHGEIDRRPVSLAQMPKHLKDAVISAEDSRFYEHGALDFRALVRATWANIRAGEAVQGGSTITQQYVKQTFVGNDRSLARKIEEARVAMRLSRNLTKSQILERYLNAAYFGRGAYGVEAAAQRYFAKPAIELTISESAMLAGLIQAPESFSTQGADDRRRWVLERMERLGHLSSGVAGRVAAEKPTVAAMPTVGEEHWRFPWFTDAVRTYLFARYGADKVYNGGLEVHTTVDPEMQQAAEALVKELPEPKDASAVVASVEPSTGYVKALAVKGEYGQDQFNIAIQGRRQPGSAFKPFVLATALEKGMMPGSAVAGMSLEAATTYSVNSAYMKLVRQVGPGAAVQVARRMGVPGPDWLPQQMGCRPRGSDQCRTVIQAVPALALGSEEVTPLEMASSFATFAAAGTYREPRLVSRVLDGSGTVLEEGPAPGARALSPQVASNAGKVLEQVVTRGTGRRAKIGRFAAGKTGTAEDNSNAWFVGYTPELSTAVWVGHRDVNKPLVGSRGPLMGGDLPAEMWGRYMSHANLSVAGASPPGHILVGQEFRQTFTVTSGGPWVATGVRTEAVVPPGLRVLSVESSQGQCGRRRAALTCVLGDMGKGTSATVTLVLKAGGPGPVEVGLRTESAGFDPRGEDNTTSVLTEVDPAANLRVVQSFSPGRVLAGRTLSWRLMVVNAGPSPATEVVITDVLPAGVTSLTGLGAEGACTTEEGRIRCRLGSLLPGERRSFRLSGIPTEGGPLSAAASVSAREADPVPDDNGHQAGVAVIPTADLVVSQTGPPGPVLQGQHLTYLLEVTNNGPSRATAVTLEERLPPGVEVVSSTSPQGSCTAAVGVLRCPVGDLRAGTRAQASVVVRPTSARPIGHRVTAGGSELDLARGNNAASGRTAVQPAADLAVAMTPGPPPARPEEPLVYNVAVTNAGPARATPVTVSVVLPPGTTFVSSTPRVCAAGADRVTCSLRSLPDGTTGNLSLRLRPPPPPRGTTSLTATVQANQRDPITSNNSAGGAILMDCRIGTPTPFYSSSTNGCTGEQASLEG